MKIVVLDGFTLNPGDLIWDELKSLGDCEIHDRMRGLILVLETPYFQKTDSTGHYRLQHLPAGRFTLKAFINENDVRTIPVELKDKTWARLEVWDIAYDGAFTQPIYAASIE